MSHRRLLDRKGPGRETSSSLQVEQLEGRLLPSTAVFHHHLANAIGLGGRFASFGYPGPVGLTPAQIRHAYGFDAVNFHGVAGDGTGQTIAIVDAFDDPRFVSSTAPNFLTSDLHRFDVAFGLPDPPSFLKLDQNGGTNYPGANAGWAVEIALDVEWAHALAPKASLVLIEADSDSFTDLATAIDLAQSLSAVSVVSMSFGSTEFADELGMDSLFTTPAGHQGITFIASSGDSGAPGNYPAFSPTVLAVGGTTLNVDGAGNYYGETAWTGSGGGLSRFEARPLFQSLVLPNATRRGIPDVAFDADPNSGVAVYDSFNNPSNSPWEQVAGTSFCAPAWSAVIAIADQGRALAGQSTLDGATQTLPKLYALPSADFHDITTGSNGHSAGPGYDLATGRGSPVVNLLAPDLLDGAMSAAGARIIASTPTGAVRGWVSRVRVTFDQPVLPASFTAADVSVTAPNGNRIPIVSIAVVPGSGYTQFNINFAPRSMAGVYQMVIGPDIRNLAGQPMDQDDDGVPGESTDTYAATFGVIGTFNYAASGLPQSILDSQTTVSPIDVPGDFLITQVMVKINLKHNKDSDLLIQLVSPSGTVITLSNQNGGSGRSYYGTIFNDFALTPISRGLAPFFGSYRPDEALAIFDGLNARGTWQLRITDLNTGNEGTLNSWSLILRGVPGQSGEPGA